MIQLRFLYATLLVLLVVEARYDEEDDFEQYEASSLENVDIAQLDSEKKELNPDLDKENEQNVEQRQKRSNYLKSDGSLVSPTISPNLSSNLKINGAAETVTYSVEIAQLKIIPLNPRKTTASQFPLFMTYPSLVYFQNECRCWASKALEPAATTIPYTANTPVKTTTSFVRPRGPDISLEDIDEEPLRNISFTKINPDRPLRRPIPAVEHGSFQAYNDTPLMPIGGPTLISPNRGYAPALTPDSGLGFAPATTRVPTPTHCHYAILKCCHDRVATRQCFIAAGCTRSTDQICDAAIIESVIDMFQKYYRQQSVTKIVT